MKKALFIAAVFLAVLGVGHPPAAEARVFVHAGFGCCGYYGGYPYYPAYYYPYAVAPPPVVYAVPPAAPVVYAQPQPQVVVQQPAQVVVAPAGAPQASSTFVDSQGRTCRHYEGPAPGSLNTACLRADGTWHTVK